MADVRLLDQPEPDWERVTFDALDAHNRSAAPTLTPADLMLVAEAQGQAIAGLFGTTLGGWLFVDRLWVAPDYRGRGIGTRLMTAAHAEAVRRGCHGAHTDTFSFQALPFYLGLGYREFGRLEGFDGGQTRHFLRLGLRDDIA